MEEKQEEIGWGKLIFFGLILLLFAIVTIAGLIQNYYAVKAIASIPKMIRDIDGNATNLGGLNYLITKESSSTSTCFENGVQINCSEIK